jgi:hypothetical protein
MAKHTWRPFNDPGPLFTSGEWKILLPTEGERPSEHWKLSTPSRKYRARCQAAVARVAAPD